MREKFIEQRLVIETKKKEGLALKFTTHSMDGMPDRIVLLPNGKCAFVEVKQKGMKPRPLQLARHEKLRHLGYKVYVLDDIKQIGGLLDEIQST